VSGGKPPARVTFLSEPALDPPVSAVVVPAAGTAPGLIFVSPWNHGGQRGPLILDDAARPVWFLDVGPKSASNFQVQQYRGESVLTWWEGQLLAAGYGKGEYPLMDDTYREVARVRAGNGFSGDLHEFLVTPAGTALFTAYRPHPADLSSVGGPERGVLLDSYLQEVDIASGQVLFEWQASKHVALDESYLAPPSGNQAYDFFHMNSIDVDDTDGNLIISARHTWAVYKISRSTGEIIWRLNGKLSDFTMGPETRFAFQHDARIHPGDILTVFDDGGGATDVETRSRGLVLSLDLVVKHARLVRAYNPDPSFVSTSQGSLQLLPDGNAFIGWGEEPYFSEYGSEGQLLFVGKLSASGSYRAFRFPWVGHPSTAPAIAAERSSHGVTVYASWNGATEVARWQVLAESSGGTLLAVASSDREGFETTLEVGTHEERVAVQALDRNGNILGRSRVLSL
jgi:Arylsulfotransferase (ASST)